MHRFFIQDAQPDVQGRLNLDAIARQLQRVLRTPLGAALMVLDGTGQAYTVRVRHLDGRTAWGEVMEQSTMPEPSLQLTLYQCALKADKFEWVLQKGTELGVSRFVPLVSARTVVRPVAALEKKRARWETILREAAEQCGRGAVPHLALARNWADAMTDMIPDVAVTPPDSKTPTLKLLPWEATASVTAIGAATGDNTGEYTCEYIDTVQASPAPSLGQTVRHWQAHNDASLTGRAHIACCIGPEGGLEAAEVALAQRAGWQVVGLGPRILRAETAALAAVTLMMHLCGEFDA